MLRFLYITLLFSSCVLTSCSFQPLDVETKYSAYSDLASVRAFTPDPKKQMGNIPEQFLFIRWAIPNTDYENDLYKLEIMLRYGNHEEETYFYKISKRSDSYHFSLDQNTYLEKKGIATYRVRLLKNGEIYSEFAHPVWTELLNIDQD